MLSHFYTAEKFMVKGADIAIAPSDLLVGQKAMADIKDPKTRT